METMPDTWLRTSCSVECDLSQSRGTTRKTAKLAGFPAVAEGSYRQNLPRIFTADRDERSGIARRDTDAATCKPMAG
jgi:hypothetical protein